MRLVLLRHGIAHDRLDPDCPPDVARPLTAKGRRRTRSAVLGLRALGLEVDVVGSSRLLRAVQTAEIVREVLAPADLAPWRVDALEPWGEPGEVLEAARRSGYASVLLAGHAPNLDAVLAAALGAARPLSRLKKAGAAGLELGSGGRGRLVWLCEPKTLRRIASRAGND